MSDTQQPTRSRLLFKGFAISLPLTLLSACTHFSSTQPTYVEALLIQQGRIRFSGDLAQARKISPHAQSINLQKRTVIPGIIDAHSHVSAVGLQQTVANLYGPTRWNRH